MLLNWHILQYVLHSYSADTYRCNQSAALNWNGFCHGSAVRPSSLNEMSSQYITANWNVLVWYEESPVKIIMQMLALEQSGLKSPTTFTLWAQLAQISLFSPIQCDPDQIFLDSVNSKKKYIEPDFFYQVLALPPYIVKDQTQICWNATSVWIDSTTVDWMSVTQRCSKLQLDWVCLLDQLQLLCLIRWQSNQITNKPRESFVPNSWHAVLETLTDAASSHSHTQSRMTCPPLIETNGMTRGPPSPKNSHNRPRDALWIFNAGVLRAGWMKNDISGVFIFHISGGCARRWNIRVHLQRLVYKTSVSGLPDD